MRMNPENKPPFPRIGEVYRTLANALDTRSSADAKHARNADRLAREADFDYAMLNSSAATLLGQPLHQYGDTELADAVKLSVRQLIRAYSGLVAAIPADPLVREQALPILAEHLFAPLGASFLRSVRQAWGGPDLLGLMDPKTTPVAVVLEWLESDAHGVGADWIQALYPGSTGSEKEAKDKLSGWRRGDELPLLQSLDVLAKDLVNQWPDKSSLIANFKRWCVLARAIGWLEREAADFLPAGVTVRGLLALEILRGLPPHDVGAALHAKVQEAAQPMKKLTVAGLFLMEDLKRTTPKADGDQDKAKKALNAFGQLLCEFDAQDCCGYLMHWAQARWFVLSGHLAEALPAYQTAFDAVLYRAGPTQKSIAEELLTVAAHLGGSKPTLKRVKHQAVAFGFFKAPPKTDIVEDWELAQFSGQFARVFPAQGRFLEAKEIDEAERLPLLCLDDSEIASLAPDFTKLDRVVGLSAVDGQKLRRPQLNLFASSGQIEKVRQLIAAGAPVDQLDVTGGSALLAAIQHFESTGDRAALDLLLAQPHSKETLDSATHKKKLTPLLCAIECGAPDVVARLLDLGASPDRQCSTDGVTPLYRCMGYVGWLWSPERMEQMLRESTIATPDAQTADALRRYGVPMAGVFGDSPQLDAVVNSSPFHRTTFDAVQSFFTHKLKATYTHQKLLATIEMLLQRGAKPNERHSCPIPGYTPLMLAAEHDAIEVFDLLVRYGGEPLQPDASGRNCLQVAKVWRSSRVFHYLQTRGMG